MSDALKHLDWEERGLISVHIGNLVPVALSDASDPHKTILATTNGKRGHGVVKVRCALSLIDRSTITEQYATHEDLSLELVLLRGLFQPVLGHDTTERVGSHEPVVTREAT